MVERSYISGIEKIVYLLIIQNSPSELFHLFSGMDHSFQFLHIHLFTDTESPEQMFLRIDYVIPCIEKFLLIDRQLLSDGHKMIVMIFLVPSERQYLSGSLGRKGSMGFTTVRTSL